MRYHLVRARDKLLKSFDNFFRESVTEKGHTWHLIKRTRDMTRSKNLVTL